MDELTPEQEEAVAATVGAIQRIAMKIVALPKEQRAAHYTLWSEGTSKWQSRNSALKVTWRRRGWTRRWSGYKRL